jgi:hypothetical protein
VVIGGAIIGQRWGITGVAWVVLLALLVNFVLTAHLGTQLVAMPWRDYLGAHGPALRTTGVVAVVAFGAATAARSVGAPAAGVVGLAVAASAAVLVLVWNGNADWLLGSDGRWLLERLGGFWMSTVRPLRAPPPSPGGTRPVIGGAS